MSSPPAPPSGPSLRVVVADNDPDALDLLELDLALEGHDIIGKGRNGSEAISLCRELNPELLVVDLRMPPGPNGVAVVEELKDQPGLAMIIYTNYRDEKLRARAKAVGAAYLLKGDLRTLRAEIAKITRR
ncbi:MAG: response regulator [Frankiaceae bacterium]|nr:response regulator [Frankiaceae bacterium]